MQQYGKVVLDQLAQKINPATICKNIGLCTAHVARLVESLKAPNPLLCTGCQYAVQFADNLLQKNATEAQIIKGLEELCVIAPSSIKQQCTSLIDQYGRYVIELLVQFGGDPNKICKAIRLC